MTTMTVETQRQASLRLANQVRIEKSRYRKHLRTLTREEASATVAALLDGPIPDELSSFRVGQLLTSIPRIGEDTLPRLLRYAGVVSAQRSIGHLTERQRRSLAFVLRNRQELFPYARTRA